MYLFANLFGCCEWPTVCEIPKRQRYKTRMSSLSVPICPCHQWAFSRSARCHVEQIFTRHCVRTKLPPPIHSLLFVDDLLICGRANIQEATTMKEILQSFCCMSRTSSQLVKIWHHFQQTCSTRQCRSHQTYFPGPKHRRIFCSSWPSTCSSGKRQSFNIQFCFRQIQIKA